MTRNARPECTLYFFFRAVQATACVAAVATPARSASRHALTSALLCDAGCTCGHGSGGVSLGVRAHVSLSRFHAFVPPHPHGRVAHGCQLRHAARRVLVVREAHDREGGALRAVHFLDLMSARFCVCE
jgi:hypothetical protein